MSLSVDIEKKMGGFHLKVSFETGGGVLALLGASGSGKSMTLKCIAGIERPDFGHIELDGRVLFDSDRHIDLPPRKRKVAYLFQEFALFPNMTVRKNISCVVPDKSRRDTVTDDMISAMRLEGLEDRKPHELSGGERQRTALARILASSPEALLLDEPFSSLDSYLRSSLEAEVADVIERLGKPAILASHDRGEAFRLSSRIALLDDGAIDMEGPRNEVFEAPKTVNAAKLVGFENIFPTCPESDGRLRLPSLGVGLEASFARGDGKEGTFTHVGFRTKDMKVVQDSAQGENTFECELKRVIENPSSCTLLLKPSADAADLIAVSVGKDEALSLKDKAIIYIPPEAVIPLA